ncbi:hypothetical protein LTS18_007653, partial [Coniosporium uncinatum]
MPEFVFDQRCTEISEDMERLWCSVSSIYDEAQKCHNRRKDENAWARVVWDVLELAIKEAKATRLEANSVSVPSNRS